MMGTKVLESTAARQSFSISPDLDDNQIARAYIRFHDEKLLPVIFSQGIPTIKAFLNLHDQKSVKFLGGFVYPSPTLDSTGFAGMGWLSNLQHGRGEVGFGYFREYWGRGIPLALTRLMVQYCFEELNLDALYGSIPVSNIFGRKLAREIGFTEVGPLPIWSQWRGVRCDGMLVHLAKESYVQ